MCEVLRTRVSAARCRHHAIRPELRRIGAMCWKKKVVELETIGRRKTEDAVHIECIILHRRLSHGIWQGAVEE